MAIGLLRALLGWKNLKCICKAIKEIEQTDDGGNFNKLAIIEVGLEFNPQSLIYLASACSHNLGKTQRGHFALAKEMAVLINVIEGI